MKQATLIFALLLWGLNLNAQDYKFRDDIDKDSLLEASIKRFPVQMQKKYRKMYRKGNKEEKEFLLFMISMPESSKKELIANFEKHKAEILKARTEYAKLVPENHVVYIEFQPASKILTLPELITIKIYKTKVDTVTNDSNVAARSSKLEVVSENWLLKTDSEELKKIIGSIGWTEETLTVIKALLDSANCISIQNGQVTTIGFARSGMGKYAYKIFDTHLTENQKDEYDDGCEHIYYKDNIVLEFGGGAIGQQCFEID